MRSLVRCLVASVALLATVSMSMADDFLFKANDYTVCGRASLEISALCPEHMKNMIHRAMSDGYLKLVAHVPDTEYVWEKLRS